jgi:hypothetical protein
MFRDGVGFDDELLMTPPTNEQKHERLWWGCLTISR